VEAERGAAPLIGVPYGADMRLFTARGIPTVMVGTNDLELAHAVDESVALSELDALARIIIRTLTSP
jgi:acetylornithine deacetylase